MPRLEFVVFFGGGEQRIKSGHFIGDLNALGKSFHQLVCINRTCFIGRQSCAHCRKQMGIFGINRSFGCKVQGADKRLFQLGHKVKRTAEERNASSNRLTAGKPRNRLIDHCLKDGCGKVCRSRALVDQRLNVGLGKHTATRGDGIDFLVILGGFVQSFRVCLQKRRHLIDERARTACTNAVHTFFKTAREVDDLCILTAKLNGNVGLRCNSFECGCNGNHLLYEINSERFAEIDRARTRNFYF